MTTSAGGGGPPASADGRPSFGSAVRLIEDQLPFFGWTGGRTLRVDHLLGSVVEGDAISADAVEMQKRLVGLGLDSGIYVSRVAAAVDEVLGDPQIKETLRDRATARSRRFSADAVGRRLDSVVAGILG